MNIDLAKKKFDELVPQWVEMHQSGSIETEQDARFQIINRMLTEVLGWQFDEIKTEPHVEDGYIDFLMRSFERNRFVIEAKRVSVLLTDTKSPDVASYKVTGPALKSSSKAIDQLESYCFKKNTPFGALTNGIEWLAHWPIRGDGRERDDYKAIVFPSLEAIQKEFAKFFDLFSREGILKNLYKVHINNAEGVDFSLTEKLAVIAQPRDARLLPKTPLSRDLEVIFRQFFSSIAGDNDPELLAKCFVETKESKEADATLEKIARNLINKIDVVDSENSDLLQKEIRTAVASTKKEFVLIIGNKGAGKSTFIDRFFTLVLDKQLQEKCLVIRVDLADSNGDVREISSWLTRNLIETVEKQLFDGRELSFDDLQGVFFREYRRRSQAELQHLYEHDKRQFKIDFGRYVTQLIEEDPAKYLNSLLWHAVGARKLMPCIVFDNTDHFKQEFQEAVFQYAQALHRSVFSFVICPITDRTIWQLSKAGPMQSYDTKAFYLPVPSTKEVVTKRVAFLRDKLDDTKGEDAKRQYFLSRGIHLSIANIKAFAACIEEVFLTTEYISRTISWLSNHDIRRGLQLSQRVLTSPTIIIDDLVKTYLSGTSLRIEERQIKRALIFGDYNYFNQDNSSFVLNVFTIFPSQLSSPLTKLSILQALKDHLNKASDLQEQYVQCSQLQAFFEPMGIPPHIILLHGQVLLDYRLIEPYDPTEIKLNEETLVRITHSGLMHIELALNDSTYVTHIGIATEIRSAPEAAKIREIYFRNGNRTQDEWQEIRALFAKYCIDQDRVFCSIPEQYESQKLMRNTFSKSWIDVEAHSRNTAILRKAKKTSGKKQRNFSKPFSRDTKKNGIK